jgi:hypothetical protein
MAWGKNRQIDGRISHFLTLVKDYFMDKEEIKQDIIEILRETMDYHNTSIDYDFYSNGIVNRISDYIYDNFKELEIPEA